MIFVQAQDPLISGFTGRLKCSSFKGGGIVMSEVFYLTH